MFNEILPFCFYYQSYVTLVHTRHNIYIYIYCFIFILDRFTLNIISRLIFRQQAAKFIYWSYTFFYPESTLLLLLVLPSCSSSYPDTFLPPGILPDLCVLILVHFSSLDILVLLALNLTTSIQNINK